MCYSVTQGNMGLSAEAVDRKKKGETTHNLLLPKQQSNSGNRRKISFFEQVAHVYR